MSEIPTRRETDTPWSVEALHGRVSKIEGWQHGVEEQHTRANTRLKHVEEKSELHDKEIATLSDIVKELRAINDTLKEMQITYTGWKATIMTLKTLGDGLKWIVFTGGAVGILWLFLLKGPA